MASESPKFYCCLDNTPCDGICASKHRYYDYTVHPPKQCPALMFEPEKRNVRKRRKPKRPEYRRRDEEELDPQKTR